MLFRSWGYLAQHQSSEVLGYIFKCPNQEGFETEKEALDYLIDTDQTDVDFDNWESLQCDSNNHNGFFYTDKQDNLHEGYPC